MDAEFVIDSQRMGKEIVAGNHLVDVWELSAHTLPHHIQFGFRVRPGDHTVESVRRVAGRLAGILEEIRGYPGVTAVGYVQDVNQAGQLVDVVNVYYQSPDGLHQGMLEFPFAGLHPPTVQQHLEGAHQHLARIAGA